ncbi:MAG: hypothetical protein IJH07_06865 [Ruminococcus sp.]|nr:hypothetical protein [Ruminococcus sp.]
MTNHIRRTLESEVFRVSASEIERDPVLAEHTFRFVDGIYRAGITLFINSSQEKPKSFHTYSLNEKSTVLHVGDLVEKEHHRNRVENIENVYLSSNETDDRSNDLTQDYFTSAVKSEKEGSSKNEIAFWHNTEQQDLQLERYNLASCLSMLYQSRVEKEVLIKRLYVDLLKIIDMKHRAEEKYSSEINNNNTQSNSSIVAPAWVNHSNCVF